MQNYLIIIFFLLFVTLVLGRAVMMRRKGIKALLFGATDKSDFLLMPLVVIMAYSILSETFGLPFPGTLSKSFFENNAVGWVGTTLSGASVIWFAVALKSFGDSFRVGIDENAPDKLVTTGMFAISRNPLYVAFLSFFIGMMLNNFNLIRIITFALFFAAIHRQILREEKFLKSHYGKEYEDYCTRVRRYF